MVIRRCWVQVPEQALFAGIAQLAVPRICNPEVMSSNLIVSFLRVVSLEVRRLPSKQSYVSSNLTRRSMSRSGMALVHALAPVRRMPVRVFRFLSQEVRRSLDTRDIPGSLPGGSMNVMPE